MVRCELRSIVGHRYRKLVNGCIAWCRHNPTNAFYVLKTEKMLRRNKTDRQSKLLRVAENIVSGLNLWSMGMLKQFARTVGLLKAPSVIVPPKIPPKPLVAVPVREPNKHVGRPTFPPRCIVFSDTDNDVKSVNNTLRFAGLLDAVGQLADDLQGLCILNTGDLIDKKNPDPSAVGYWQHLLQDARTRGAQVKLIVGNHEQEIWQHIRAGETYGMKSQQIHALNEFIESLDLFYVAGPVLFIHGYPTLEFLQTLLHYEQVTGKDLNSFNSDHYRKAFKSVNGMRQYAYVRENRQANYLLYDVANASRYYKKQGREVGAVLEKLKIEIVLHGHRPQRSGVQVDYEFGKWIPKIRMIGNDTVVRRRGLGATIVKTTASGGLDTVFINTKTKSNKLRKRVQEDLRAPRFSSRGSRSTVPETADMKSAAQG